MFNKLDILYKSSAKRVKFEINYANDINFIIK